jgi:hypothetical protein
MAIAFEVYTTKEQCFVVLLWIKGHNAKDIYKKMFLLYGGKFSSPKAVQNWVGKRGKRFTDDEEFETEVQKSL